MTWTLWRGEELIGDVLPRRTTHGQPGQVSGVLVPRPGSALPKGGSQHHIDVAGLSWVAELPGHDPDAPKRASASGELERNPPGVPVGSQPDKQLSIRDETNEVVRVRAISLDEHRLHPEQPVEEVAALPDGAIVAGSVWLVAFWLQPDADAT